MLLFHKRLSLFTETNRSVRFLMTLLAVPGWIVLLRQVSQMDVDNVLPAHGDVATKEDVAEMAKFLGDEYAGVKDAVAKGMTADQAAQQLTFPQYSQYRNYRVREHDIRSLYDLIKTGKSSYLEPGQDSAKPK